jgi:hypothetical protein
MRAIVFTVKEVARFDLERCSKRGRVAGYWVGRSAAGMIRQ